MPNSEPFTLAVCAEMVFRSLPITERVRRIPAGTILGLAFFFTSKHAKWMLLPRRGATSC